MNEVRVVAVEGDVDISRAPVLREELRRSVDNHDLGLVVDLSETRYLDSAGVNVLFELAEDLTERQLGVRPGRAGGRPGRARRDARGPRLGRAAAPLGGRRARGDRRLGDDAQVPEGLAAQLADDRVHQALLVAHLTVGDRVDQRCACAAAARPSSRRSCPARAGTRRVTALSWPIRCRRSSAWSWRAGVQSSSRNATFDARVSVMPCDAAFIEQTISCGPSSSWKASTALLAALGRVGAEDVQRRRGSARARACWVATCSANTTSGSPEARKSPIQASAVGQLAVHRELAQVVEPHQLLGAQRGGDLRVERAQVERQRLEPARSRRARRSRYSCSLESSTGTVSWRLAGSWGSTCSFVRRT